MPLIDVTLKPDYALRSTTGNLVRTRGFIRYTFNPALPALLVDHSIELGMDADTPVDGVQVEPHDYDPDTVNAADLWVKVQFSEERPSLEERLRIRGRLYNLILEWFVQWDVVPPDNFIVDVFWGPTNGCGRVNGVYIEW